MRPASVKDIRQIIGTSVSEPHTSLFNCDFFHDILLGECRTLWGEREQAMHCGNELLVAKALPVKYQITAHTAWHRPIAKTKFVTI